MALEYLFQGSAPPAVTTTAGSAANLPDWYQQYLAGLAAKGTELAGNAQSQPVPTQSVAGFTPDQLAAFQKVRGNQGAWQPLTNQAAGIAGNIVPQTQQAVNQANQAVAGPAGNFTQNWQQYMSPYTQSVVDEIARLGNQNFEENLAPGVNSTMIGSGQFGSTRNAEILGRAARDTQTNISGLQAQALQQGYGQASDIFAADANRQQQQQQMQAGTALTGASTNANAASSAAGQLGGLGQAYSALGLADAQALAASGQQQQQLQQAGLDTAYTNQQNTQNAGWQNLDRLNSIVRGMPLPTTQTTAANGPAAVYQPGALQTVGSTYGWLAGNKT